MRTSPRDVPCHKNCSLGSKETPNSFKVAPNNFKVTPKSFKGTPNSFKETPNSFKVTPNSFKVAPKKTTKESYKNLYEDLQKENILPHKHTSEASNQEIGFPQKSQISLVKT